MEIIDDDCNCESIPFLTYCPKCKRIYLVDKDGDEREVSLSDQGVELNEDGEIIPKE